MDAVSDGEGVWIWSGMRGTSVKIGEGQLCVRACLDIKAKVVTIRIRLYRLDRWVDGWMELKNHTNQI